MAETKAERKERLQAMGVWDAFVKERASLITEGASPEQARDEAERRVTAQARDQSATAKELPANLRDDVAEDEPAELLPMEPAPRGIPQDLFDARQVMDRDDAAGDRGPRQRLYRKMKESDPFKFADWLRKMEKEYKAEDKPDESEDEDVGTAKAVAHAERLLAYVSIVAAT